MTQYNQNFLIILRITFLNVSSVDDDVLVSVDSRLFVEETSCVHELVNNQRDVDTPLIQ